MICIDTMFFFYVVLVGRYFVVVVVVVAGKRSGPVFYQIVSLSLVFFSKFSHIHKFTLSFVQTTSCNTINTSISTELILLTQLSRGWVHQQALAVFFHHDTCAVETIFFLSLVARTHRWFCL